MRDHDDKRAKGRAAEKREEKRREKRWKGKKGVNKKAREMGKTRAPPNRKLFSLRTTFKQVEQSSDNRCVNCPRTCL